jgi:hypothetical protein
VGSSAADAVKLRMSRQKTNAAPVNSRLRMKFQA